MSSDTTPHDAPTASRSGASSGLERTGVSWLALHLAVAAAVMFVATLVPTYGAGWLGLPKPGFDEGSDPLVALGVFVVTCFLYIGLTWLACRFVARVPFRSLGLAFTRRDLVPLAAGLVLSAVAVSVASVVVDAAGVGDPVEPAPPLVIVIFGTIFMVMRAFVLQGIGEELVFRGYVMRVLRTRPVVALCASSLVFGALHWVSTGGQEGVTEKLVFLLAPTGFAFAGGALMLLTGSLWGSIAVHAGYHLSTTLLVPWFVSRQDLVWVSLPAGLLYVAMGLLLLVAWRRQSTSGAPGLTRS